MLDCVLHTAQSALNHYILLLQSLPERTVQPTSDIFIAFTHRHVSCVLLLWLRSLVLTQELMSLMALFPHFKQWQVTWQENGPSARYT